MLDRKIVVIGDEDAVFGLGLIGLSGRAVTNIKDAREAIQSVMADPEVALILLTENMSAAQPESKEEAGPLIVVIPSAQPGKPTIAIGTQIEQVLGIRLES
jgi:vacuolar-type H+-ATPase subunit F/Vma7